MGELELVCTKWLANWEKYFLEGSLLAHMKEHPLQKGCIDYFVNNRFVGYSNEKNIRGKAYLEIVSGIDYTDFKYAIRFNADLSELDRVEATIHEITHAHYLSTDANYPSISNFDEELITEHAKKFVEENMDYSKEIYFLAMKMWKPYSWDVNYLRYAPVDKNCFDK